MYKQLSQQDLDRRSKYPSIYDLFSSLTAWHLGTSLTEYPKYLLKVLMVKQSTGGKLIVPRAIIGLGLKLLLKAAFIIVVMKLYGHLESL